VCNILYALSPHLWVLAKTQPVVVEGCPKSSRVLLEAAFVEVRRLEKLTGKPCSGMYRLVPTAGVNCPTFMNRAWHTP